MEDFYNKLNQKLSNEESLEGVHSERLWDKIEKELDAESSKTNVSKLRRWGIWFLVIVIATMGLYFINTETQKEKTATLFPKTNSQPILAPQLHTDKTEQDKIQNLQRTKAFTQKSKANISSISSELTEAKNQMTSASSTPMMLQDASYNIFSENDNNVTHSSQQKSSKTSSAIATIQEYSKTLEKTNTPTNSDVSSNPSWKALELVSLMKQQEIEAPKVKLQALSSQAVKIFEKPQLWAVEVGGGIHFAASYFGSNNDAAHFGTQLDSAHTPNMKYQFSLGLKRDLNENLHLFSGIEYYKTGQRFDVIQVRDSTIQHESTGVTLPAEATRTVRNYNSISYMSLPVMLGWSQHRKRWEYGVRGGISLNWIWNQQGKTILPHQEISTYSNKSSKLPYKKMFVSYSIHPYINYYISSKWAVQLRPHFSYQMHGNSPLWNIKHNALQGGVNMGLVWKW